jgi:hypothetical protein
MKDILSKAFRIMGIYVSAMVIVSAVAFLAETEPPKKDKAHFTGFCEGGEYIEVIREVEKTEKTESHEAEQNEDNKTVSPFEFDVNIITETKREIPPEKAHSACLTLPSNSMAFAFAELERRKKYFQLKAKAKAKRKREEAKERKKQSYDPEHSPDYNYKHTPGTVAGVSKGEPMSFEQANGGAPNPYYNSKNLYGYHTNCQSCTVAFEARQRGYDVRALPNNRNPYIKDLAYYTALAYVLPNGQHPTYYSPMFRERTDAFLDRTIKEGERYNIEWTWRGERSGHIISVQRENGNLVFYDPQSSEKRDFKAFKNQCLSRAVRGSLRVMRVDNCELNPEIVDYVLKGVKK